MNRAYSILTVKTVQDDQRIIRGIATTPTPDRVGDIVEPLGVKFSNPLPLLHQHDSACPVGTVTFDPPTKDGITFEAKIPVIAEPGPLKDRVDMAWGEVKAGLVRAVSIGFSANEYTFLDTGGVRFTECTVLELSLVTIPAQADAVITTIKSIDGPLLAASGKEPKPTDRPANPALRDPKTKTAPRAVIIKTARKDPTVDLAEQIKTFEASLNEKSARLSAIMEDSATKGQTLDAEQSEEYDGLEAEVVSLEAHIKRLKKLEGTKAVTAKPVSTVPTSKDGTEGRAGVVVKSTPKLAPGVAFARLAKVKAISRLDGDRPADVAERLYGADSEITAIIKTAVVAGSNVSGSWAANLVGAETSIFADFAAFLRPATVLGKFGVGDVPSLRAIPFRVPLISQTGGGAGYWVGEGKAKPLTAFDFARTTMQPLKVANIAVLTEESIRDSSPSSDAIVRDSLRDALAARLDTDFIDPSKAASAGVSPASITNGAATVASTGTSADAVRLDVRAVFQKFILADNAPDSGVWIMSTTNALALSLMVNALGQPEFPGITMMGGTFFGLPVIASRYAGAIVTLVNASDIYLGDEDGVSVDMSREASLEMSDAPAQSALTGTGASLVSMFQTNSVALRAERTINWQRRRASAVAYLTAVNWGGTVPAS